MTTTMTSPTGAMLDGIPNVDLSTNLQRALKAGKKSSAIVREIGSLRLGPGKLTPEEFFWYGLWDSSLGKADKRRFVGKIARHPMHVAAGAREWFAASADKILFQSIMDGWRYPHLS